MKSSRLLCLILSIIATITSIVALVLFFTLREKPASKIYDEAIRSIVEVKAYEDDYESYGTGVFIDDTGRLVTNAHVIKHDIKGEASPLKNIEIRFSFEDEYRAVSLEKYDFDKDLAILKLNDINGVNFKPIEIRSSNNIKSGETAYAIGNGLNHGLGITKGIISLPLVNIEYNKTMHSVIQADIIINNGNSGGALLDKDGRLIGITEFRLKESLGNPIYGIAYSIPSDALLDYIK